MLLVVGMTMVGIILLLSGKDTMWQLGVSTGTNYDNIIDKTVGVPEIQAGLKFDLVNKVLLQVSN